MPVQLPPEGWILVGVIGAAAILTILSVFGSLLEHQLTLHDLRVKTLRLRMEYMHRLQAMQDEQEEAGEPILAIPVDEAAEDETRAAA